MYNADTEALMIRAVLL